MRHAWFLVVCGCVMLTAVDGAAQVTGAAAHFTADDAVQPVVVSEVTFQGSSHSVALRGISVPQPGFGFGAKLEGGMMGVYGYAEEPSSSTHIGVAGTARNGRYNIGVNATAEGTTSSGVNWGVFGEASCAGSCQKYGVYSSGDLVFTGSLIGPPSDLSLKENIADLDAGLGPLLRLRVVSFQHKTTPRIEPMNLPAGRRVGFVAQQVAEVFPELVVEVVHPPRVDPEDGDGTDEPFRYQAVKVTELIPILVRAIQEQQAQIESLQKQMAPLRSRLEELEQGRH